MTESHSTTASVSSQDRDDFGLWLSGFTDGEGSFILSSQERKGRITGYAKFVIAIRDDDRPILEDIRSFLGCGCIQVRCYRSDNPQARLDVCRSEDLLNVIIPTFERYFLRAKKRRDFEIWKEGVRVVHRVSVRPMTAVGSRGFQSKWTADDVGEFLMIADRLNGQRKYVKAGS